MSACAKDMAARIVAAVQKSDGTGRQFVAIAGPPASGKSTLADLVAKQMNVHGGRAGVLPMDGFHLDNAVLDARGLRSRKGAPETFDLGGLRSTLERLRVGGDVIVPVFDRDRDLAIAGARVLAADTQVIVVEGNYLLLDCPGWRDLSAFWDVSVYVPVADDELRRRLRGRWAMHGMEDAAALAWIESNDMPNARIVADHVLESDLVL